MSPLLMVPQSCPCSQGPRNGMDAAICCTVTRATLGMSSESSLPVPPWRELAKWKQNATAMPPSTGAEARRPPRTLRVYTTHSSSTSTA